MPRADAVRNRDRLLAAALAAFAAAERDDADAEVSLERIARDAGVGIGTLYRHFPTREALVEAVYRDQLERLCAAAPRLLAGSSPDVALRRWMDRYADFVATKRGMAGALRAVLVSGAVTSVQTRATMAEAVTLFLAAGEREGSLRADVRAEDVVAALAGALLGAVGDDPRAQTGRLLDLLLDGLRP